MALFMINFDLAYTKQHAFGWFPPRYDVWANSRHFIYGTEKVFIYAFFIIQKTY